MSRLGGIRHRLFPQKYIRGGEVGSFTRILSSLAEYPRTRWAVSFYFGIRTAVFAGAYLQIKSRS
jgi:hypothetical protein